MGRPRHEPTTQTRKLVKKLAMSGLRDSEIAPIIEISESSLKTHYREELRKGRVLANSSVASALYRNAMKGNVIAQIFWAKTRLGWTESGNSDANSEPIKIDVRVTSKGERLKPSDFDEI